MRASLAPPGHPVIGFIGLLKSEAKGFEDLLEALTRSQAVLAVTGSLDPAVAFLIGWLLLHERVTAWDLVGLACVVLAGIGVTYDAAKEDIKEAL